MTESEARQQQLERRIEELERRMDEIERRQTGTGNEISLITQGGGQ